ncbi:staphylopine family metallophore export MFS transporter CntE [Salinithrix halophila]|uniref:Staphylopine family metallophore export MFS transporter CntE n=1 Tax=Salinithrix halophila TaxID=1485204 RepID=A0ABV8JI27_9BACL
MTNRMEQRENPFSFPALQVYAVTILFYSVVYMVLMILPFYALAHGANQTEIGWIMGVTMFTSMLARPSAGKIIDRWGARRVFVIALLIFSVSLLGYFVPDLWVFGIVRAIQGVVAAFFSTAMEIITMDLLSERLRGQGLSLYSLATMLPTTFGPALTLYLKDLFPMGWIFGLLFVMGALNFGFSLLVARKTQEDGQATPSHSSPLGAWKSRVLVVSSTVMLLASVANGAIFTFLPLYLKEQGSPYGSIYFLVQTVVLVLCRFFGRHLIRSDGRAPGGSAMLLAAVAGFGSLTLGMTVSPPLLMVSAVLNGLAFSVLYPTLLTFISFRVPEGARGFLIGLFIGAADFGFALGALAMGPVADIFSYPAMFQTCSLLCFIAALCPLAYRSKPMQRAEPNQGTLKV